MLEVNIFDRPFVNACRALSDGLSLFDNSLYYFANGVALGFTEKRPYTIQTDLGYWVPSGTRSKDARAELEKVNAENRLLNYVRNNFDNHVESMVLSCNTSDLWKRVHILVASDRVYIQFPDVRGQIRQRDKKVRMKTSVPSMPITVMPELVEKLLGICEAADLPLDFDPQEVITSAYRGTCEGQHIAAHGYAMVLLLQNKIVSM